MKRLMLVGGLFTAMSVAGAQGGTVSSQCAAGATQDACQKALDLVTYLAPQLGTAIAGGNTTLGMGGALGGGFMGIPHFTIGVRGTGVFGSVPKIDQVSPSTGGAVASAYTTSSTILPFPAVDAAVGVYPGFPLPMTHIGAVDLLLSGSYVPSVTTSNVSVTPTTNISIGYGLRVGLLQEGLLTPGVAVSAIHRGLPKTTISTLAPAPAILGGGNDTLTLKDVTVGTNSYRLTVGKNLIILGLAAGVGIDQYNTSTTLHMAVKNGLASYATANASVSPSATRTSAFVDASMNLLVLNIVGEVGMVSGGTINTFNTYDKAPNASRPYAAVGLRVGL